MAFDGCVVMASFLGCPASQVPEAETSKGPPILRDRTIILEKAAAVKGTFSVAKGEAK
jgi:hypothetical protein